MELAAGIDAGAQLPIRTRKVSEAEFLEERDGVRAASDEGLGAHVHRTVVEGHGVQLAADAPRRLEHVHLVVAQLIGRSKPGDAGSDDGNLHY